MLQGGAFMAQGASGSLNTPIIENSETSFDRRKAKSRTVQLPAGIVSGELLIAYLGLSRGNMGVATPTGWHKLFTYAPGGGTSYSTICVLLRIADGSEPSSITVATSEDDLGTYISMRISNHNVSIVSDVVSGLEYALSTTGTTKAPQIDPPSLTTSLSGNLLWIAGGSLKTTERTVTGIPVGFSDLIESDAVGNAFNRISVSASRQAPSGTLDPSVFTFSGSSETRAGYTLAIEALPLS